MSPSTQFSSSLTTLIMPAVTFDISLLACSIKSVRSHCWMKSVACVSTTVNTWPSVVSFEVIFVMASIASFNCVGTVLIMFTTLRYSSGIIMLHSATMTASKTKIAASTPSPRAVSCFFLNSGIFFSNKQSKCLSTNFTIGFKRNAIASP